MRRDGRSAARRLTPASPFPPNGAESETEAADPGIGTLTTGAATAGCGAAHGRAPDKEGARGAPSQEGAEEISRAAAWVTPRPDARGVQTHGKPGECSNRLVAERTRPRRRSGRGETRGFAKATAIRTPPPARNAP